MTMLSIASQQGAEVWQETGLTPRQFAEENDRLKRENENVWREHGTMFHELATQTGDLRRQLADAMAALRECAETIESCDETDLLACDSDPHPPSALSVLAERARAVLAKYL